MKLYDRHSIVTTKSMLPVAQHVHVRQTYNNKTFEIKCGFIYLVHNKKCIMWETVFMASTGQKALSDVNLNNYTYNYTYIEQ
jgi:acetone carboxylase gamma subunit